MNSGDPVMYTQARRRWFIDLVHERFGERLAEARWILDVQQQFAMFDAIGAAEGRRTSPGPRA